ncbi:hypothetical protein GCM10028824_21930 [Hymenobacter segetis]|uniref:Uncharacterized protein n=1 Tax=Hymenobacter segetis TaxID=2025509 RepID=A0ABU9LUI2_9BACT
MFLLTRILCAAFVIGFLVSCGIDNSTETKKIPSQNHDLGAVTIQLPDTWKEVAYDSLRIKRKNANPRHLFMNFNSQDSVRESMVIMIDDFNRAVRPEESGKQFIKSLIDSSGEMQVISSKDTVMHNGDLSIKEVTCRSSEVNLDLIQTYAIYKRGNMRVALFASALNHSGLRNQKNRTLFRQTINSIKWK